LAKVSRRLERQSGRAAAAGQKGVSAGDGEGNTRRRLGRRPQRRTVATRLMLVAAAGWLVAVMQARRRRRRSPLRQRCAALSPAKRDDPTTGPVGGDRNNTDSERLLS